MLNFYYLRPSSLLPRLSSLLPSVFVLKCLRQVTHCFLLWKSICMPSSSFDKVIPIHLLFHGRDTLCHYTGPPCLVWAWAEEHCSICCFCLLPLSSEPNYLRPSPLLSPPCFEWYLLVLKSCCGSSDQCSVICCSSTALHNPGWELFISLGCWGWAFLEVSHWTVRSYQTLEMSPVLPGSQSPPKKLSSSYSVQNLSCSFASIIHFCPQIFLCCSLLRKKKKKKRAISTQD